MKNNFRFVMMNYIFRVTKSENATSLINNYYSDITCIQLLTPISHFNDLAALSCLLNLNLFYFVLYLNFLSVA